MNLPSEEDRLHTLYSERVPNDTHSTSELIAEALSVGDVDEHAYWEPVTVLWDRRSVEVLDAARQLCVSHDPKERELGASILSQLAYGSQDKPELFHEERLTALLQLLGQEEDKDVLAAACLGLGHLHDPRSHEALIRLKNHVDPNVRHGVAFSLDAALDKRGLAALIELSADVDRDVRNWATFNLGHKPEALESDALMVQEALATRLYDPDEDTRCEAIVGLTRYNDMRAMEPLIKELEVAQDYEIYNLELLLEAATELPDATLCPALLNLKHSGIEDEYLDEALDLCGCT